MASSFPLKSGLGQSPRLSLSTQRGTQAGSRHRPERESLVQTEIEVSPELQACPPKPQRLPTPARPPYQGAAIYVHQPLGFCNRLPVKRRDSVGERVDKCVELTSGRARLTYPYNPATSPAISSAPRSTSNALPRPISRGNRAIGPPPGTNPAPTSHWERMAFSRLANRCDARRKRGCRI